MSATSSGPGVASAPAGEASRRASSAAGNAPAGTSSPKTITARSSGSAGSGRRRSIAGAIVRSMAMKSTFRKRAATTRNRESDWARQ